MVIDEIMVRFLFSFYIFFIVTDAYDTRTRTIVYFLFRLLSCRTGQCAIFLFCFLFFFSVTHEYDTIRYDTTIRVRLFSLCSVKE